MFYYWSVRVQKNEADEYACSSNWWLVSTGRTRTSGSTVGDGACGKTCLLIVFSKGTFPEASAALFTARAEHAANRPSSYYAFQHSKCSYFRSFLTLRVVLDIRGLCWPIAWSGLAPALGDGDTNTPHVACPACSTPSCADCSMIRFGPYAASNPPRVSSSLSRTHPFYLAFTSFASSFILLLLDAVLFMTRSALDLSFLDTPVLLIPSQSSRAPRYVYQLPATPHIRPPSSIRPRGPFCLRSGRRVVLCCLAY